LIKPGGGWESYPENMCMWRAVGFAADIAASDVTCGLTAFLKMPEQMGIAIDNQGDVIDAGYVQPVPDVNAEIIRLSNDFGAMAVMAANGNQIPSTLAECAKIEAVLFAKMMAEQAASE
jgi:nitrogenase subunit NifH